MEIDFSLQRDRKLVINERNRTRFVDVESITHLTCCGYLTTIHFINNEKFTVSKLLKEFELELTEYRFLRANYNTIVNVKYISRYINSNRKINLINNIEIYISRRRLHLFKKLLINK